MKILVTGGLGFIGSNFIRYLLENYRDIIVYNVDKESYGSNRSNLKDLESDSRYRYYKGDINNSELMKKILKEVNVVVNFAAETHVDRSISDPTPFIQSNILGVVKTLDVLRSMKEDIRFIHISTDEVYGDILEGSFNEESRLKPSNPYSASKASADMFVMAYIRTYGLDALIVRPTNNYGPYQNPEKLIPKTIIRASLGMKVPIYGSGRNKRDWLFVLDTCEAIKLLIDKGVRGEIYNISTGKEVENIELVTKILNIMGLDRNYIEFVEDRPGHDKRYSIDSSKIRSKLGWKPRYSLEDALEYTVKWYLDNRWWWRPLINEKILHPTPWKLDW